MMDPSKIPRGAYVDAKWLRCPATRDKPISKVLNDDNTSSCLTLAPPLDDDNQLEEILLRLYPNPLSLPRASLFCTRWQSILSDHQFRNHHWKLPLLGFFTGGIFTPILDSPDRIPATRFSIPQSYSRHEWWRFMGCRHGLALLLQVSLREAIVWEPLTGKQCHVIFPPGIGLGEGYSRWNAGVLCSDAADGHVHGDCFSSSFELVLICVVGFTRAYACIYDSASCVWGHIVSTPTTNTISCYEKPSVLVENTPCWLLVEGDILAFDLERQSLGVINKPADFCIAVDNYDYTQLLRTANSGLVITCLSELTIQLWERKSNCDGVFRWVLLQKTIQLEGLFPHIMQSDDKRVLTAGYDEDTNVIVLSMAIGNYMLQLDSMQTKDITKRDNMWHNTFYPYSNFFYPYANFYTAGRGVGWKRADQKL